MTREEQLFFCKKCKNREFNLTEGVLCKLTGKKADFEETCPSYELDKERETKIIPSTTHTIRPNLERAVWAQHLIWAVLFVQVLSTVSSFLQYNLLQDLNADIFVSEEDLDMNDLREGLIGILSLIIYIISGIVFIRWFRRAYYNLKLRTKCRFDEGWAAGGWFVPILSLFRPYQIMSEIQTKTTNLINKQVQNKIIDTTGPIIGIWWTLWIVSNYIGNYTLKALFKEETIEVLINSTIADIAMGLIDLPMGILAVMLVKAWSKKETLLLELERKNTQVQL